MNKTLPLMLLILAVCAPAAMGQEWIYPGAKTKGAGKKSKSSSAIKIKASKPALMFQTAASGANLTIDISDGKQKFGKAPIMVKSGENTYLRPRLLVSVPMEKAKAVKAGAPLSVISFSHLNSDYELKLVHNANSAVPDTVVTQIGGAPGEKKAPEAETEADN